MDVSAYLSEASFWSPDPACEPRGRGPFDPVASWLVDAARPRQVVQLGSREPGIHLAAREAVRRLGLDAECLLIDTEGQDDSPAPFGGPALRRAGAALDRADSAVSARPSLSGPDPLAAFEDGSIDLLVAAAPEDAERIRRDFDRWSPKLSETAILAITGTGEGRSRAAFRDIATGRPTFEFTHGGGLGLVALGRSVPPGLAPLFEAGAVPSRRDAIRRTYARLAGHDGGPSPASRIAPEDRIVRREELLMLREELSRLEEAHRAIARERDGLAREHEALAREAPTLRHALEHYRHHHAVAAAQLDEVRRSTALRFIERGRRLRDRLFPQSRLHGRCLELSIRVARVAAAEGPRAAASRVSGRLIGKARKVLGRPVAVEMSPAPAPAPAPIAVPAPARRPRFLDLPWRGLDPGEGRASAVGAFKILLVSHAACRTGAPLCLLRLAEELSRLPDVECWVVLRGGGDLEPEFARRAPTVGLWNVVESGVASWDDAPGEIAARFREYAPDGIAVCNTMAVSEFHRALGREGVPVLSWIHELPTFIGILGGAEAIDRIKAASRRAIVPADVVRDALVTRFNADPEKVRTVRYGLEAKTLDASRDEARERVREELNLPADALIVLGCGTIDQRKGADLFVQAARRFHADPRAAAIADRTWFVWFGHVVEPNFRQWLWHDVESAGLGERVLFAGTCPDMTPNLLAADVFALTSREDPCPFANLEAMEAALPVVAFAGSGGAPEVLGGGGVVVPYLDVDAMAETIRELLLDAETRDRMGGRGRSIIRKTFTWPRFMADFLGILREDYGYAPAVDLKVSAIVPNYRHAPYLEERLRSVFEQTVRPHEIIFLDDCSPDDSLEVARRLAPESPVPMRIVVNETNSGSTFKQWMKGMELASGDLIWLAESDDVCDARFLERLVPEFRDPDVALAYCQSALVGPNGETWAPDFLDHTDDLALDRWRSRYKVDAAEEAEVGLSQKNTIPNASAAVFRKPSRLDFAEELAGMKFAGDWLFYAMILRGGKIAFAPESLNSYRRHEATVSFQSTKADTHAEETLHVKRRVFETYDVSLNAMARGLGQTLYEYDFLGERFGLKRPPLSNNPRAAGPLSEIRELMRRKLDAPGELRILLVVDGRETGLAAVAAADLANALAREHAVYLCCAHPSRETASSWGDRLEGRVVLLEGTFDVTPWSAKPTGGKPASRVRTTILQELIRFHEVDAIHSLGDAADRLIAHVNVDLNVPWFVHLAPGHDAWLDEQPATAKPRVLRAVDRLTGIFHEGPIDEIIEARPELAGKRWTPLYPGLRGAIPVEGRTPIARREDEFLVYLIDQGPEARDAAMSAVRVVNRTASGERGGRRARLVMADEQVDALALLSRCDAAVAPMAGIGVGVARQVAATLACRLPVVAPDSGPVHELLTIDDRAAGIAAPAGADGLMEADRVAASILRYMRDEALLEAHRDRAAALFEARFHVDRAAESCVEAYFHARDFLVFASEGRPTSAPQDRTLKVSRESA
ncbi:glycosyltransferase [Paludisphaera sp.]|uniref:glycosyltransferase n=1 Tax=Paludisphaera sp. TaxID=2017432 RepID=UPI00301BDBA8